MDELTACYDSRRNYFLCRRDLDTGAPSMAAAGCVVGCSDATWVGYHAPTKGIVAGDG